MTSKIGESLITFRTTLLLLFLAFACTANGQAVDMWDIKKQEIEQISKQMNMEEKSIRFEADKRLRNQISERNLERVLATSRIEAELRRSPHFASIVHAAFGKPGGAYVRSLYVAKGYERSSRLNEDLNLGWKALSAGSALSGGPASTAIGLSTSTFDLAADLPDLRSVGLTTPESRQSIAKQHENDSSVAEAHEWRMELTDPKMKWTNEEWSAYLSDNNFGRWQNKHNAQFLYDLMKLQESDYSDEDIKNGYQLNDVDIADLRELVDMHLVQMPNWSYMEAAFLDARQTAKELGWDHSDSATPVAAGSSELTPLDELESSAPANEQEVDSVVKEALDAQEAELRNTFLGEDDALLSSYIAEQSSLAVNEESDFSAIRDRLAEIRSVASSAGEIFDNLGVEPPVALKALPALVDISDSMNNIVHLDELGEDQLFAAIDAFTSFTGAIKALSSFMAAGGESFEEVVLGQIQTILQNQKSMLDKLRKIDAKQNYLVARFHDLFQTIESIQRDVGNIERLLEAFIARERSEKGPSLALSSLAAEWTSLPDRLSDIQSERWAIAKIKNVDKEERDKLVERIVDVVAKVNRLVSSSAENREELLDTFLTQKLELAKTLEDEIIIIEQVSRWPAVYQHALLADSSSSLSCSEACSWMNQNRDSRVDLGVLPVLTSLLKQAENLGLRDELQAAEARQASIDSGYMSAEDLATEISQYWAAVNEDQVDQSLNEVAKDFVDIGEDVLATLRGVRMAALVDLFGGAMCWNDGRLLPSEHIHPEALQDETCGMYGNRYHNLMQAVLTNSTDVDILLDPNRFLEIISNTHLISIYPFIGAYGLVYFYDDEVGELDYENLFAAYEYNYFAPTYNSDHTGGTNMILHFHSGPWGLDIDKINDSKFITEETKEMVKEFFPSLSEETLDEEVPIHGVHQNFEGVVSNVHGYHHYVLSGTGNGDICRTNEGAYLRALPDSRNCLQPITMYRYFNNKDEAVESTVRPATADDHAFVVEELLRGSQVPGTAVPRLTKEEEAAHLEYMDNYHKRVNRVTRALALETFLQGGKHYSTFVSALFTGEEFRYEYFPSNRHQAAMNNISFGLREKLAELARKHLLLSFLTKLDASKLCEPKPSELATLGLYPELDMVAIARPSLDIEVAISEQRGFIARLASEVERLRSMLNEGATSVPTLRWESCGGNYNGTAVLAVGY